MNKLSLSIVILHYNNYELTEGYVKNLKSLSCENYDRHIIIVDNNSPDGSGKVLSECFGKDQEVDVILLDENIGFAKGNNVGILFAKEKYNSDLTVVSNSDIEIDDSDFFEKVIHIYERDRFDIFGPDIYGVRYQFHQSPLSSECMTLDRIDSRIRDIDRTLKKLRLIKKLRLYTPLYKIKNLLSDFSFSKKGFQRNYSEYQIGPVIQGAFFILAKSYLEEYPDGLYPGTFLYLEEHILNYRAKLKGLKVVYDPSVSVKHLEGVATLSYLGDRYKKYTFELEQTRESCFVMRKYILENLRDRDDLKHRDIKISVIIPCYNVEKYLKRCLDSIINQTYRNLEIILVNDGSTDRTGKICDFYAKKDRRIKVINKENGGSSTARNVGIENSIGEYISFCDSDDWIELDTYEYLVSLITDYDAECAVGSTCDVYTVGNRLEFHRKAKAPDRLVTSTEAMKTVLLRGSGVNNRLFKREIFDSLRFPEGIINEDEAIMIKIYAMHKSVVMGGRQTYYYRKRANSNTTSKFSIKNLDWYKNTLYIIKYIRKERPELLKYAYARHYKAAVHCSAYLHIYRLGDEGRKYRKQIRNELRHNFLRFLNNKYVPLKYKLVGIACCII